LRVFTVTDGCERELVGIDGSQTSRVLTGAQVVALAARYHAHLTMPHKETLKSRHVVAGPIDLVEVDIIAGDGTS
jgi:hypothetical protein